MPGSRQQASAEVELMLGFCVRYKRLRWVSANHSARDMDEERMERGAVPAMGRAAPVLLALLSLAAAVCDAQDACPGECPADPAAIPDSPLHPPRHREPGDGYGFLPSLLF